MPDEYDELIEPVAANPAVSAIALGAERRSKRMVRLACRLYGAANPPLRAKLVACLLKPLGILGTAGIAAGAFSRHLYPDAVESARMAMRDVVGFSNDQMIELVRFVEQVSPDALQEFARLFEYHRMSIAAFTASAALLLLQSLSQRPNMKNPGKLRDSNDATPVV